MTCNLLNDPDCLTALQGDQWAPSTAAEVQQIIDGSNLESWFNQYQNNLQGFNGNFDAESGISFNLAPFLAALCKAYQLTGSASLLAEMENRIDQLFDKNDQNVQSANVQIPDANGNTGNIVPYSACAVPAGFDTTQAHCGWSRWAPNFIASSCPSARARPELLTDGLCCYYIMRAIKCMKDCGELDQSKAAVWLDKVRRIIDVWDSEWRENHTTTNSQMGPLCQGTVQTTVTGQYVDQFDKTYPLNQQVVMLAADLIYQQCASDRTGAKDRAGKVIQDINNQYFVQSGGVDTGWYYTLFCNCTETIEDLAHTQITFEFLKTAAQCGAAGASNTLTRMANSLKANAYQGGGDWAWYNNGVLSHGTLANPLASGPWGSTANTVPGCSTTQSFSSGSGGGNDQLFRGVLLLSDLPEQLSAACKTERDASMQAWQNASGGTFTPDQVSALLCYSLTLCEIETGDVCMSCSLSNIPAQTTARPNEPETIQFVAINTQGNPITTGIVASVPSDGISQPVHIGNGVWQSTFQQPDIGSYTYSLSDGCESCLFTVVVAADDPTCIDPGATVTHTVQSDEVCISLGDPTRSISIKGPTGNQTPDPLTFNHKGCNDSSCGCSDEGHRTAIHWCNMCLTGEVSATGTIPGSRPEMACECEAGQFWQIQGVSEYTIKTDAPHPIETVIFDQHDLCAGATVELFNNGTPIELTSHEGTSAIIAPGCSHCGDETGCSTLPLFFACQQTTELTVRITPINFSTVHSIGRLFAGQSQEIEPEFGFGNPFLASCYRSVFKNSACGYLPPILKPRDIESTIEVTDLCEDEIEAMLPMFRYMQRMPVYFSMSTNHNPGQTGLAVLGEEGISPPVYSEDDTMSLSIPLRVNCAGFKYSNQNL